MKNLDKLSRELDAREGFKVLQQDANGGMGMFTMGPMRKMTVIWARGSGWEHVSMDGKRRMPSWDEMCTLKDMFFEEDECAVQYHPPKSEYVNNIRYCLHLWRPMSVKEHIPMPPAELTGIKGIELR